MGQEGNSNHSSKSSSPVMGSQQQMEGAYQPQPYQPQGYQPQAYQPQGYQGYQVPPQQYGYYQPQGQPDVYGQQPGYQVPPQQVPEQYNNNPHSPLLASAAVGGGGGGHFVEVQPVYQSGTKFPEAPEYKDKMFHIMFYVNLAASLFLYIFMLTKDKIQYYQYDSDSYASLTSDEDVGVYTDLSMFLLGLCAISVVYGFLFIFAWMKLASRYPKQLITYTFIGNMVLTGIFLIIGIIMMNIALIILMALCLVITFIFFLMWRKRIEFTGALLSTTTALLAHFPGAYRVAYGSLVSMVYFTVWALSMQRALLVYEGATFYGVSIYLVFTLYWVSNVIKSTVHVTISGLFASWYFLAGGPLGMPKNPTLGAFKRAVTTSFGSICFGSLLLAIISTLRYVSNLLQNSKNGILQLIGCFMNCILGLMQNLLAFFNVYTYTQIAIYGKSYCEAAEDTLELFRNRLISILVNDDFVSVCLSFSSLLGALGGGIIGGIVSKIAYDSFFLGALLVFTITFIVIMLALEVVYSGVVTIFVCFLQEPSILEQTKPEIYKLYVSTYKIK